jgi:DnaA-homolog protein
MQQLSLDVHLVQPPSFDNFVAGPNAELLALLSGIVAGDRPSKCLFIWGEPGSGKSHLLEALRESLGAEWAEPAPDNPAWHADTKIALLDDAQNLNSEAQIAWFGNFIRQADAPGAMIIACADQAPLHLNLRADLRTRLGSGLIFQLKRLNDDQKAQALRQHAASRQITLPEELLRYLLRHYPRDIRLLMQILDSLDRFAFEQKRAPSLPLLRDMESQADTSRRANGDAKTTAIRPD